MNPPRLDARVPFALALLMALGCEPDARNDATLFLDRVELIDLDDPIPARRRRVDALARIPFTAEQVLLARDACVEAHRGILEAEDASARARAAFERYPEEGAIPVPERQRIERDLRQSNQAVARSRELFADCHRLTRDLELRYRPRRRRAE